MTITQNLDINDYRENIQRSTIIPHCQIISPKDKTLPFGFFIPMDKASACEFTLDDATWELHEQTFGESEVQGCITKRSQENKTFLSSWIRLVIVRSTPMLAFQPNEMGRAIAVGEYYARDGGLTAAGRDVESNKGQPGYFRASKYLLYFLDGGNRPLHSSPLQFKARGGVGGSFGSELRMFYQEFDRAFMDGALGQNNRLDAQTHALSIFAFRLGVRQGTLTTGSKGAWYCHVAERLTPTCNPEVIGQSTVVSRKGGGEIKLVGVDWKDLFVSKKSEVGVNIQSDFIEYESFGKLTTEQQSVAPADNLQTQPAMGFESDAELGEDFPY